MHDGKLIIAVFVATIQAGTPLAMAALGELVAERSGVLNLGVEGMMLMGAVTAFIITVVTHSALLGVLAAMGAGMVMAGLFGVLTQVLLANQVATGLALTIFGGGLSAFVGLHYTGISLPGLPAVHIPLLSALPAIGPALFSFSWLVYVSWALPVLIYWFLYRSRAGLVLRAVGESPHVAHSLGYPVVGIRFLAVLFGGAMAGMAGAYLSLAYTPLWQQGMTAGRGWIALALVVFATWRPGLVMAGAYLFGFVTVAQYQGQGLGINVPSDWLAMLPYLATIAALVLISADRTRVRLNAPVSLGKVFHASG